MLRALALKLKATRAKMRCACCQQCSLTYRSPASCAPIRRNPRDARSRSVRQFMIFLLVFRSVKTHRRCGGLQILYGRLPVLCLESICVLHRLIKIVTGRHQATSNRGGQWTHRWPMASHSVCLLEHIDCRMTCSYDEWRARGCPRAGTF